MNLNDPTPKSEIKQRQGPGGRTLDYVDARYVMDRLDAAVGPENWQDKYEDRADGSVRCCIGIRVKDEWVWKCDVGDPSDIEAVKGAHSDAFKRAGVKWGIARDLYGEHSNTGRTGTAPVVRAAAAGLPQPAAAAPIEPEWDGIETAAIAAFPDAEILAPVGETPEGGHYGPTCPKHKGRPWKDTGYGPKCTAKDDSGPRGYCIWRPSRKWIAENELVPA
jgi:hypothetical protein